MSILYKTILTAGLIAMFCGGSRSSDLSTVPSADRETSITPWDLESVLASAAELLSIGETELRVDRPVEAAEAFRRAARRLMMLGRRDEAAGVLGRALRLERSSRNRGGEAETLAFLAYVSAVSGEQRESHRLRNSALLLANGDIEPNFKASVHYYVGEVFYLDQDIPNLQKHFDLALALYEKVSDQRGVARTLRSLSYAALARDDAAAASELAVRSVNISAEMTYDRGVALSHIALGLARLRTGRTDEAALSFQTAETMFPEGLDTDEKGVLLYNTGRMYESFEVCDQAIRYYRQSLALFRESGNISLEVGNLWSLGTVLTNCNVDGNEPLQLTDRALGIAKRLGKMDDVAYSYITLGSIHLKVGDPELAIENFAKGYDISRKKQFHLSTSKVLIGLGESYHSLGNKAAALRYFNEALELNRRIRNIAGEADALAHIATSLASSGEIKAAIESVEKSIQIVEELTYETTSSILSSTYFSAVDERYRLYIRLLMRLAQDTGEHKYTREALIVSERARARMLAERLTFAPTDRNAQSSILIDRERHLKDLLNLQRTQLNEALIESDGRRETDHLSDAISQTEHELEKSRSELMRANRRLGRDRDVQLFDLERFQQNSLDENTVFLEFSFGEDESYLWLVSHAEVSSYVLPPRDTLEKQIARVLELLRSKELKPNETVESYNARNLDTEQNYSYEAGRLSLALFGESASKIKRKRLVVSVDGTLGHLPLATLPVPDSVSSEPLLAHNEIVYVPSALAVQLTNRRSETPQDLPSKDLVIFADAVFSAGDERLPYASLKGNELPGGSSVKRSNDSLNVLQRLEGSHIEAMSISDLIGSSHLSAGFAANREEFLGENLKDFRIIHIATHGVTNDIDPDLSGILLSRYRSDGEAIEGFIRTSDIYGLRLSSDLVVLSSCGSGVGKELRGEGIVNLASAFLQAGSKSVVSSLWKVDDDATQLLMADFYRGMSDEGLPPAVALRKAQLRMMASARYGSPYYWAAFTIHGVSDEPIKFSTNDSFWWKWSLIAGLLCFAVLLVWQRKKVGSVTRRLKNRFR